MSHSIVSYLLPDRNITEENVDAFLEEMGFSKKNTPLIKKYYSQKPSYAVNLAKTLLTLDPVTAKQPDGDVYIGNPKTFTNDIYEYEGKVYYRTKSSSYPIKNGSGTVLKQVDDDFKSLFELTDEGFKFFDFETNGEFTGLMETFLNDVKNLNNSYIITTIDTACQEFKADIVKKMAEIAFAPENIHISIKYKNSEDYMHLTTDELRVQQILKDLDEKKTSISTLAKHNDKSQDEKFKMLANQYKAVSSMDEKLKNRHIQPRTALRDFKDDFIKNEPTLRKSEDSSTVKFFKIILTVLS